MKALNETPTAELIAEVANIKLQWKLTPESERGKTRFLPCLQARFEEIAAELDRRCKKLGIAIENGVLIMYRSAFDGEEGEGEYDAYEWTYQQIENPSEFHALLGWLLIRDGK